MVTSKIYNEKSIVFLFLLLFASGAWLYVKMQDYFTTEHIINFKMEIPDGKIPLKPIPKDLLLTIEGKGSELAWNSLGFGSKLLEVNYKDFEGEKVITSDELMSILNTQIVEYNILSIKPDTIFIQMDDGISKKIPIVLDQNIQLKNGYTISGDIKFKPDSIEVRGPKAIIDTLSEWTTETISLNDVSKYSFGEIGLTRPESSILFDSILINYEFNVEQLTEITLRDIPIEIEEFDFQEFMLIDPKNVELTFNLPISEVKNISPALFRAVADFKSVNIAEQTKVPIKLIEKAEKVSSIRIKPNIVDFRIKTND